jgi:hypothetical protein
VGTPRMERRLGAEEVARKGADGGGFSCHG